MTIDIHTLEDVNTAKSFPRLASLIESVRVYLLSLPMITRGIVAICIVVQIVDSVTHGRMTALLCLAPNKLISGWQVTRIVTHAFVHTGWFHLILNMMTLISFGPKVELHLGSIQFANVVLQFSIWGALIYTIMAFAVDIVHESDLDGTCVLGFSGVLFALLVVFVYKFSTSESVKVFGLFPIPNTIAPWAALLLFQLIPHVSFLGHLSGMATGYAFVGGCMHRLMFTAKRIKTLRAKWPWCIFDGVPGFVDPPADLLPTSIYAQGATGGADDALAAGLRRAGSQGRFPGEGRTLGATETVRNTALYAEDNKPPEANADAASAGAD